MKELGLGLDKAGHRDQTLKTKLWWKPIGLNFCNMRVSVMSLERDLYIFPHSWLSHEDAEMWGFPVCYFKSGNHRRHQWEPLVKSWCCPEGCPHTMGALLCLYFGDSQGTISWFLSPRWAEVKPNGMNQAGSFWKRSHQGWWMRVGQRKGFTSSTFFFFKVEDWVMR